MYMKISIENNQTFQNTLSLIRNNENHYNLDSFVSLSELNNFNSKNEENFFINQDDKNYWFVGSKNCDNFIELGSFCCKIFLNKKIKNLSIDLGYLNKEETREFITGFMLRKYKFVEYKTIKKIYPLEEINITNNALITEQEINSILFEIDTINTAKNWINSAPCDIYPEKLASNIKEFLKPFDINVKIISGEEVKKFPLLYAVGKASINTPHVVVMEYNTNATKKIAFAGKGVTYDTGGLSIKPSRSMSDMKCDMSAAAVVASVLANAAKNNYEFGVIGIVGLVENSIGNNAYRPDDVVYSYNKKSVEIINTDAEGRLVLADIMSYAQEQYKPEVLIDLATLTGGAGVSLGSSYSSLFSNDKELATKIVTAGEVTKELTHLMPLHKDYSKYMQSRIADIKNCCYEGPSTSTAAAFLNFFIEKQTKWAHLDIASVSYLKKEKFASEFGATGYGIRLINEFLKKF